MHDYYTNTPRIHRAALKIASTGKPVFPCRPDKSPYTPRGFKDASIDPGRVNAFWNKYPNAKQIGMPTGRRSSVFVMDVDRLDALGELEHELPETLTIRTPSGGLHLYFEHVDGLTNSPGALPQGIDIRGEGGYVIVPPSPGYRTEREAPIAAAPNWLLEKLREKPASSPVTSIGISSKVNLDDVAPIPDGGRNNTLTAIGGALRARGLEEEDIRAELLAINAARCEPPLDEAEVCRIAKSVSRYAPGKAAPDADTLEALDEVDTDLWRNDDEWRGTAGKTDRDAIVALIKAGRQHSRLVPAGVEVSLSVRALALAMAASKRSAGKAVERLKEAGWLVRGQKGLGTKAGTFILLRRAKVSHSYHRGGIEPPTSSSGLHLRAPFTAPRLRWGAPGIKRLGKTCGAVLDYLEKVGGSATIEEAAAAMGVSRVRDFRRRVISRLEASEVVECNGHVVSLMEGWLDALNREREVAGETAAARRDIARYARERAGFKNRFKNRPDETPSERCMEEGREAWRTRQAAAGEIAELERVPEPLSLSELYELMYAETPVETTSGPGRLWQVFSEEVGIILDDAPKRVKRLHPVDVLGPAVKRGVA